MSAASGVFGGKNSNEKVGESPRMMSRMGMNSAATFVPSATFGQLIQSTFFDDLSGCGLAPPSQSNSGRNREHPRRKSWAPFRFRKAPYRNCTSLRDLIEICQQLNLIMVCAEYVGLE